MANIKIHVFHTGEVCVAPDLPFGGDNSNAIKASGILGKKEDRLWLPVSAYLIEHPKGKILSYYGGFTKFMSILSRIVPRSVTRKYAAKMNR